MAGESDRVILDVRLSDQKGKAPSESPGAEHTTASRQPYPDTPARAASETLRSTGAPITSEVSEKRIEARRSRISTMRDFKKALTGVDTDVPYATDVEEEKAEKRRQREREMSAEESLFLTGRSKAENLRRHKKEKEDKEEEGEGPPELPTTLDDLLTPEGMTDLIKDVMGGEAVEAAAPMVSAGITKLSGSTTAGALAGTAAGKLAPGMMAKLGPMAGPLAIGTGIALVVSEINNAISQKLNEAVVGATERTFSAERGDPVSGALGRISSSTKVLDPLQALTGINLNPLDDTLRTFIEAIDTAVHGLDQMAEAMTSFSGEVSAAQAQAEVRRIQTEMLRAKELGPEMSEFITSRSEMREGWEEIKIAIVNEVMPLINTFMEIISGGIEILVLIKDLFTDAGIIGDEGLFRHLMELLEVGIKIMKPFIKIIPILIEYQPGFQALKATAELLKRFMDWLEGTEEKENRIRLEIERFLDPEMFFGAAGAGGP